MGKSKFAIIQRNNSCPLCKEKFNRIAKITTEKSSASDSHEEYSVRPENQATSIAEEEQQEEAESLEQNLFSVLLAPETRGKDTRFLQIYAMLDSLAEE
jgi:uncharacterized Zn finger protein (UPF0148 family)